MFQHSQKRSFLEVIRYMFLSVFFIQCQCCSYETFKQRMGAVWTAFEFRMCLGGDKPWVLRQFHHFHDASVRGETGELHAVPCQVVPVIIIYFVAVTVPFLNGVQWLSC